jgi:hypothetical protein
MILAPLALLLPQRYQSPGYALLDPPESRAARRGLPRVRAFVSPNVILVVVPNEGHACRLDDLNVVAFNRRIARQCLDEPIDGFITRGHVRERDLDDHPHPHSNLRHSLRDTIVCLAPAWLRQFDRDHDVARIRVVDGIQVLKSC